MGSWLSPCPAHAPAEEAPGNLLKTWTLRKFSVEAASLVQLHTPPFPRPPYLLPLERLRLREGRWVTHGPQSQDHEDRSPDSIPCPSQHPNLPATRQVFSKYLLNECVNFPERLPWFSLSQTNFLHPESLIGSCIGPKLRARTPPTLAMQVESYI